ncbi:MAG TPA: creatininase family protein [Acidobacteria bacterium]|nr:creatininase family protein [Acidobacteriota bacterium]
MPDTPIPFWHTQTTIDVAALAQRDPVVILPLAATEQHGPHLPLSTDLDIGLGLLAEACRRLPPDVPVSVLPPQTIGVSREHARFPGTLSLDPDLATDTIRQHGAAVAATGIRRLVLFNSHGGNSAVLDLAALALREAHGLLIVKASYFAFSRPPQVALPESEWRHGLHGGALETAMMLHLRPDLVRTDAIQTFASIGQELEKSMRRLGPEGEASFGWLAGDLNATGATGDATLATPEMGAQLVRYYGEVLAEVIADARAFPLEGLRE